MSRPKPCRKLSALLLSGVFLLGGCASQDERRDARDPLEPMNRTIYQFNEKVDDAVLKPVARGYRDTLPQPVRTGVANFFSNIDDVVVLFNDVLQFKLEHAVTDLNRVVWNSTLGIAGLFDVASKLGMEKRNEDFGQTLGYWGVGNGPYLVLPFLGPSTLRDTTGRIVDAQVDPLTQHHPVDERNVSTAVKFIDGRARLLSAEKVLDEAALDPYVFMRDAWLQRRHSLVHDGNPPRRKFDEED